MKEKKSLPARTLEWINDQLDDGMTVDITTALKVIRISPKTFAAWKSSNTPLFKVGEDGLRIAQGKRYDLIATNTQRLVKISAH